VRHFSQHSRHFSQHFFCYSSAAPVEHYPAVKISAEQRQFWEENTKNDEFNTWFNPQIQDASGKLDLEKMYEVARRFGILKRYDHLNPGQQRMIIGSQLRTRWRTSIGTSR
jgi:hypothetical protein